MLEPRSLPRDGAWVTHRKMPSLRVTVQNLFILGKTVWAKGSGKDVRDGGGQNHRGLGDGSPESPSGVQGRISGS